MTSPFDDLRIEPGWLARFLATHGEELVAFRRHLHAHPELSGQEVETTELVVERLRTAGLQPRVLSGGVGLVCDVGTGRRPPRVALRADLDALAMEDEKEVSYRSRRPGVAHACGHDVHTTVVLGAGLALAGALDGDRVRLLFEPAEEQVPGGAPEVIAEGGIEGIEAVFGLHCDPKLDVGRLGVRPGPLTAAADLVEIELHGPGGHTARPHLTVDLVALAGRLAVELPGRLAAAAAPGEVVLAFGSLHAGDAPNVIPTRAVLRGSLRTPDRDVWDLAEVLLSAAVAEVADGTGATWHLHHRRGVPPVVNHEHETRVLARAAARVLGPDGVVEAPRSTGADSFSWYLEHCGGSYGRLGTHPAGHPERLDLHSGSFDVDERSIALGVAVLVRTALDWLGQDGPGHVAAE